MLYPIEDIRKRPTNHPFRRLFLIKCPFCLNSFQWYDKFFEIIRKIAIRKASQPTIEWKNKLGGAFPSFKQDSSYGIKNAPFNLYVIDRTNQQDGMRATPKENGTINGEGAVDNVI